MSESVKIGTVTYPRTSVSKEAASGAAVGAAIAGAEYAIGSHTLKDALKKLGTKDTFEAAKPLEHICCDTINRADTYLVKGTRVTLSSKFNETMNFDTAQNIIKDNIKGLKKTAPKVVLAYAAATAAVFGGIALAINGLSKGKMKHDSKKYSNALEEKTGLKMKMTKNKDEKFAYDIELEAPLEQTENKKK